jgi:L-histidine N-alpha-methyltransferase
MGELLRPGDFLLTGFDLVKAESRLIPAYSDARGVTAEFNYNLLDRMNRELGADFDRSQFRHEATFNKSTMAMESWLVSQGEQDVFIQALEKSFHFADRERLRTEVSQKFKPEQVSAFANTAGFCVIENFTDDASDFLDALWEKRS